MQSILKTGLYPLNRTRILKLLLLISWAFGILCGCITARHAQDSIHSLMHTLCLTRMSIVGGALIPFFPLVTTAIVLSFFHPAALIPVAFLKAYSFGLVSACVVGAFGSAGWLLRWLLVFSSSLHNGCLLFCWLNCISEKASDHYRLLLYTAGFMAFVLCFDYFTVSPFVRMLFVH